MRRVRPSFTAAARRTERSIFSTGRIVAASTRSAESRADEGLGLEREPERFEDLLWFLLPQLVDELGDEEGPEEGGGGRPFGRRQVGVARRHREAVALADGGRDPDFHGEAEVRDEAHHDGALLGVLLAEDGDVGEDEARAGARRRWRRRRSARGDAPPPSPPRRRRRGPSWRSRAGRSRRPAGRRGGRPRRRGASPRRRRGRAGSARSLPRARTASGSRRWRRRPSLRTCGRDRRGRGGRRGEPPSSGRTRCAAPSRARRRGRSGGRRRS